MAILASDDFNRADSADLGANWQVSGTAGSLSIVSNRATNSVVSPTDCQEYFNDGVVSWPANQYSEIVTFGLPLSTGGAGPTVRWSNTQRSGYAFEVANQDFQIYRWDNGTKVELYTDPLDSANAVTLRLEMYGTTLRAYINGVLVYTGNDATYAGGYPGITARSSGSSGTDLQIESWSAGDAPAPATGRLSSSLRGGLLTVKGGIV